MENRKKVRIKKKKNNQKIKKENQMLIRSTRSTKIGDVGYTHTPIRRPSNQKKRNL